MQSNRIEYLDIAKAIAIISVVAFHVMLFNLYSGGKGESQLMNFCGSYQLMLFFFVSGIVSKTTINIKDVSYDIYKRFRCLIVPAIVIGVLYTYMIGLNLHSFIWDFWKMGYWYLFVLFNLLLVNYIYALAGKYNKAIIGLYIISVPLWVVVYRHLYPIPEEIRNLTCIEFSVKFFPYFMLGNLVKRYGLYEKIFNIKALIICLAIWIVTPFINDGYECMLTKCQHTNMVVYHLMQNMQEFLNIFLSMAKVITIISICKLAVNIKGHSAIAYIGRCTLFVYIFHYFILQWINMIIPRTQDWYAIHGNFIVDLLSAIIPVSIVLLFSLGMKWLIAKYKPLYNLVFFQ